MVFLILYTVQDFAFFVSTLWSDIMLPYSIRKLVQADTEVLVI